MLALGLRGGRDRGRHGLGLARTRRRHRRRGDRGGARCTASRASPITATRSSRAWRSTSRSRDSRRCWATRGFTRAARRRCSVAGARFATDRASGAQPPSRNVPALGPIYREVVSGHNVLVYIAAAAVPVGGLDRIPHALRAAPARGRRKPGRGRHGGHLRRRARATARCVLSGVLCGLSGAYLSIAHHASFIRDMSAGKGYLALAALIFGQWRPVPTLGACLLFAFADAVQARLQGKRAAARRRDAGSAHPGAALRPDGAAAGRLRRAGGGARPPSVCPT